MSRPMPAKVRRVRKQRAARGWLFRGAASVDRLTWRAVCPVRSCKFDEPRATHNGAHIVAARHNREHHTPVT